MLVFQLCGSSDGSLVLVQAKLVGGASDGADEAHQWSFRGMQTKLVGGAFGNAGEVLQW